MKRIIYTTVILLLPILNLYAQKVICTYGWAVFSDYNLYSYDEPIYGDDNGWSYSLFSVDFGVRVNLFKLSEESVISLNANPAFTLSDVNYYGTSGGYSIPIVAAINFGGASTRENLSDKGFGVGVGVTIEEDNLFGDVPDGSADLAYTPTVTLDYRRWSSKNKLKEYSLRVGYGSATFVDVQLDNLGQESFKKVSGNKIILELFFRRYINF
jgi:hypothetical protein